MFAKTVVVSELREWPLHDSHSPLRGVFFADRWWNPSPSRDFAVAFPEPDGRLRVNPDPGRLEKYHPHFNSMTVQCAEQIDGELYATDVLVNVDTLIEYERTRQLEEAECALRRGVRASKCAFNDELGQATMSSGANLQSRYQLRDYGTVPENFRDVKDEESNIRISVGYESWSCCSSCCCSADTCGHGYALTTAQCKMIESYRTRIAHLSFFKINILRAVNLRQIVSEEGDADAISTFDRYLSTAPYISTGIAIHSTLLTTDRHWLKIRNYLFEKMVIHNAKVMAVKGRLGQYVQAESCEGINQSTDCRVLEECRKKLTETTLTVVTTAEKDTKKTEKPLFGECGSEIRFTHVELSDIETILTVVGGENYVIQINETLFGDVVKVDWSFGNAHVSLYNERYPCASQRVASTKNHKGLLLVHVIREDTLKPYVGKATMLADGGQAAFKVLLKYTELVMNHHQKI
uniref:Apple domain-containing protein n=1 Tax=Ascaris lumbricoides TaxID=6252 RepID=A0A0M3HUW9_ASCLU